MAKTDLKSQLQNRAEGAVSTTNQGQVTPANQIQTYLARMAPEIAKACGSIIKADELGRVALTTIRLNPALLECNIQSLMAGVMQAAQLGLRIDPTLGQAYLVPFNRKIKVPGKPDQWTKEAQFIIGYRGLLALIRNSGEVSTIVAHAVYENDHFTLQYGLEEKLEHIPWHCYKPNPAKEGGSFLGAYCVAKLKDGGHAFLYMPKAEIDEHRKRSKSADSGPWVTDYEAMALKTVVKGISKWLPMSIDDLRKINAADETVKTQISANMSDVTDITAEQQPINVGQITDTSTGETAISEEEIRKHNTPDPSEVVLTGNAKELLNECYQLLEDLSKSTGDSPDDVLFSAHSGTTLMQQDLEGLNASDMKKVRDEILAYQAKTAAK